MSSVWIISYNDKPQLVALDHERAELIRAQLLALGERRETMDITLTPLPLMSLDAHAPYTRTFYRATKTMFADPSRKITPNVHSWERILPCIYLSEEEDLCIRNGGIHVKVNHSKKEKGPVCAINVIGFEKAHVLEVFEDEVVRAHNTMKEHA